MPRPAQKRGTPASKRGTSREQVAVLTAIARGSRNSFIAVLPSVPSAATAGAAAGPVLKPDTVLVSDSASACKTATKALGMVVRQIPRGTHRLGPYHIQNVNAPHCRIKEGLRPFRGVATKNLPVYLGWFRFFDRTAGAAKPQQLVPDAIGVPTNSDYGETLAQREKNHSMNSSATSGVISRTASATFPNPLAAATAESAQTRKPSSHSRSAAWATSDGKAAKAAK